MYSLHIRVLWPKAKSSKLMTLSLIESPDSARPGANLKCLRMSQVYRHTAWIPAGGKVFLKHVYLGTNITSSWQVGFQIKKAEVQSSHSVLESSIPVRLGSCGPLMFELYGPPKGVIHELNGLVLYSLCKLDIKLKVCPSCRCDIWSI